LRITPWSNDPTNGSASNDAWPTTLHEEQLADFTVGGAEEETVEAGVSAETDVEEEEKMEQQL